MKKTFVALGVVSLEESINFYCKVLDFKMDKSIEPTDKIRIVWLKDNNGFWIELIERSDMPSPNNNETSFTLCITDLNLEAYSQRLQSMGIGFNKFTLPNGKDVIRFKDPNNLNISLMG